MLAAETSLQDLRVLLPYGLMAAMWLILLVAIYNSLEFSAFRGSSRLVISFCAATLAVFGGHELYLKAVVPAYVAMGLAVLLGVAAIIRGGFKKVERRSRHRQQDDEP